MAYIPSRPIEINLEIAALEALADAGATDDEADSLCVRVMEALCMDYSESLSSAAKRHLKDHRKRLAA